MPQPFPNLPPALRGDVRRLWHTSAALAGNPWGDPVDRDVFVYTPSGYDGRPLPAVLLLAAYAGTGEKMLARGLSEVSMATRIDRLISAGCPPFLAVMPDTMTSLGGSQYVDSAGIGAYATYCAAEVTAFVAASFPVTRWAVAGKSSGGFGALHLAMTFPGRFDAVACHSGDMGFDLCYLGDIVPAVRGIQASGGIDGFVRRFWEKEDPSSADFAALNVMCLSNAYSPGRYPVDFVTGEVHFSVLQDWRRYDPVVRDDVENLRTVKTLFVDAGDRDEYQLHLGARRFVRRLQGLGIGCTYEEFKGGHRGTSYRWDRSLPILVGGLK